MNLVSVIVPCYNMSAFLEETLASVVASDYRPIEVLVVDDGSTDDSAAKAKAFAETHSSAGITGTSPILGEELSMRVIQQANSGVSAARNNGLRQAQGTFVLPVDADDRISPTFISHAVQAMEENPARKVVYCRAEYFGERQGEWRLPPYSPRLLARKNMIPATALYRREDALRFGGYCEDEVFREDWDFWLSMLENGGEVLQLDEVGFFYRVRGGSRRTMAGKNKRQMVDMINRRHEAYMQRWLGGPLHYHRSWSRLLNFFRSERGEGSYSDILLRPAGTSPTLGEELYSGSVIHSGRNVLREQDGLIIKEFAKPGFIKAIVYGLFCKSKARRSYEYAQRLLKAGIATPEPVAYKEVRVCGLLRESYYVCRKSACPHTFNDLISSSPKVGWKSQSAFGSARRSRSSELARKEKGRLAGSQADREVAEGQRSMILSSIGRFTAAMHEAGALHRDYSGGNILFDDAGHVEIIDLNRICWRKHIDCETGCKNFERLNINREALTVMATAYAEARGLDVDYCVRYVITHRWRKHVRQGITNLEP